MAILSIFAFTFWKLVKRTNLKKSTEVDLVWERPSIDAYEETTTDVPTTFWREMGHMLGVANRKNQDTGF